MLYRLICHKNDESGTEILGQSNNLRWYSVPVSKYATDTVFSFSSFEKQLASILEQ